MNVICELESDSAKCTPIRDARVEFSRVPSAGEKVVVFSDAEVLCQYRVVDVVHHQRGTHAGGNVDATIVLSTDEQPRKFA